ncbi:2-hydroxyacylsphingosine 1-beta-galactosyltransferase-like isoform X2 [Belonocnema kinseyi]|uniref:2-hydroxyacylsphingosine 1-beta-galactosyltransferase-like isoform X2 n=1 Tax=Belonocnema kinseyi TaxID=2817044 RepID=UPI00143D477C|nr:2-hydroxyacylsphingosine 1-beta-galactosyltransferase-like isoform X2 [Belonocnema kinseyi]XP_033210445.1 2-hydroxyacylsphingosine 1-beta-galactosyltransferase-like isoform X2 [Belonocnema kinseyi]
MDPTRHIIFLFILFLATEADTARILGIFPLSFKSHNIFFQALMKGLAKQGHQVDIISHHELPNPPKNYETIINLATLSRSDASTQFRSIQEAIAVFENPAKLVENLYGLEICDIMRHEKIQKFIKNPPKDPGYDLIITEGLTMSCYYGLGAIFKVPVVTATACLELPWISYNIGNPLSTAFYPTIRIKKSQIKNFWDRLQNTIRAKLDIYRFFALTENQSKAMKKYLGPNVPNVREVEKMIALSIVNTHHSIQGIRPTVPAFVEVAGIHIEEDESNFTRELKEWMDDSKTGVVYVSLGSTVPIETLPKEQLQSIYSSFAKLAPIRVLLKATDQAKLAPNLSENVLTMTWIPQIPVLRHNNTKAFISHGGLHSVQEAIYYAVPIIGIPLFMDQQQNVEILVNKGMGIQLNHIEISEKSLDEALMKILKDPKYRKAAKYHSSIFRDRPMSPLKTAIFWIEYVIRNGPDSLKSPALNLFWWQQELLDVCIAVQY